MDPYIGEIRLFSFDFEPRGWLLCNGQVVPVNIYSALYSLLGDTYGPASHTAFTLPDFRGRVPVHSGHRPGFRNYELGASGGQIYVALGEKNIPNHSHDLLALSDEANTDVPTGNILANTRSNIYASPQTTPPPTLDATMKEGSISHFGFGEDLNNMQPFLTMNFFIAYEGIYPQRP